ncbi:unnamed protein product [Chrysoparadoxa australica]
MGRRQEVKLSALPVSKPQFWVSLLLFLLFPQAQAFQLSLNAQPKSHKVVVLDSFTADQGVLGWEGLKAIGNTAVYPRSEPSQTIERIGDCNIILTNKVLITEEVMAACPQLEYIGVTATGFNVVDMAAAQRRGIAVTNVPAYSTDSVVQMVMAYLLHDAVNVSQVFDSIGGWPDAKDFCYFNSPMRELSKRTLLLIGMGSIGSAVAKAARALGMEVLCAQLPGRDAKGCIPLADALPMADYISLHCPLTADTRELVNGSFLRLCKRGAVLINTARGPLVDETALVEALATGVIRRAYVDVLVEEPPPRSNPLLNAPDCFVTPHVAWGTTEARQRLIDLAVANVDAFTRGERLNRVEA